MSLVHRLSAVLLSLGLIAGDAAVCAGWAATPEARMACCVEGGICPMHAGTSQDSASRRALTQAEADSCCASSEAEDSSPATPTFGPAIFFAVLGHGLVLPAPVPALVLSDAWRTFPPIRSEPVPRYILLSVFLV